MTIVSILPQARTTFLDVNSNPLSGGFVYFYVPPNTTTLKTTYQDAGATIPNSNPVVLDGNGSAVIYGSGQYLMILKDSNNNTIWSGLTEDSYGLVTTGNNTFTGNNIFTGAVALGSSATAITQLPGDNSTAVATDAFVSSAISVGGLGGFINKLRNPTFAVAQLGTSGTSTTSGGYTLDGWFITPSGASCTWFQQLNIAQYNSYNLTITGASGVTDIYLGTRVSSEIMGELFHTGNVPLTFQLGMYNGTGNSISPVFTTYYFNSIDNSSSITQDVHAILQPVANGANQIISYTFLPGSPNYKNGMEIHIDFLNNFGSTSNFVAVYNADLRATPGITIGINNNPPPVEMRPIGVELPFCQNYRTTSYGNGVTPGTTTQKGFVGGITANGSNNYPYSVTFPNQMRATPSVQIWDGAGNLGKYTTMTNNSTTNNVGTLTVQDISTTGFQIYQTSGNAYFHYLASAEL